MPKLTYNELDNGIVERFVLHVPRLFDKIEQVVYEVVVKYP